MAAVDTFNGADQNLPVHNSNWHQVIGAGNDDFITVSNQLVDNGGGDHTWAWRGGSYGNDHEAILTLSGASPARGWTAPVVRVGADSSGNAYTMNISPISDYYFGVFVGGSYSQFSTGSAPAGLDSGSAKLKMTAVGTAISWYIDVGSGWSLQGTQTDSTFSTGVPGIAGYGGESGTRDDFEVNSLGAGGAIAGSSTLTFTPSGSLKGTGALVGPSTITFTPAGSLKGTGALVGPSTLTFTPSGSLKGTGALVGSSTITFTPAGSLKGTGALVGPSPLTFSPTGTLAGTGALVAPSTVSFTPSGSLTGTGALVGSSTLTFTPSGSLTGTGALVGSSLLTFSPTGSMGAPGALAGSSTVSFSPTGSLTGVGDLSGSSLLAFSSPGTLTGSASLVGAASLSFSAVGSLNISLGAFFQGLSTLSADLSILSSLSASFLGTGYFTANLYLQSPPQDLPKPVVPVKALMKQRIQNALTALVKAGPFYQCKTDSKTGQMTIDMAKTVVPSVSVKEVSSGFQMAKLYKGSFHAGEIESWVWEAIVEFPGQEVACEGFEQAILDSGIKIPPIIGLANQRTLLVRLSNSRYGHPPEQSPNTGTRVVFEFEVVPETLRK